MLGSLQDAGNTVTLAGYINLLDESGLLCGLQKFSVDMARRRASIPKLQVYNNALKMVYSPLTFEQAILNRKVWGRIFESGIGSYLVSQAFVHRFDVFYWRERDDEVDFVLRQKGSVVAIKKQNYCSFLRIIREGPRLKGSETTPERGAASGSGSWDSCSEQ